MRYFREARIEVNLDIPHSMTDEQVIEWVRQSLRDKAIAHGNLIQVQAVKRD